MCFSVVSILIENNTHNITVVKMLWTHEAQPNESSTNWATSQSARFALVSEYVSSIHQWANSNAELANQSACFALVML